MLHSPCDRIIRKGYLVRDGMKWRSAVVHGPLHSLVLGGHGKSSKGKLIVLGHRNRAHGVRLVMMVKRLRVHGNDSCGRHVGLELGRSAFGVVAMAHALRGSPIRWYIACGRWCMILALLVVLAVDDGIAVVMVATYVAVIVVVLLVGQSLMTNEKITSCIISTHGREARFSF